MLVNVGKIISGSRREGTLPFSSALGRPQLCPVQRHTDMLVQVQQKDKKMAEKSEHLLYKEWLRELGIFSLEKRGSVGPY